MIRLYKSIENKLGTQFGPINRQSRKEDVNRAVGIFLYESSNDEYDSDGIVYECIKAHIEVNASNEVEITEALQYLRRFVDRIEEETSGINGLTFEMVEHVGPKAVPIGKNGYNLHVCVSNIDIKYNLN